MKKILCIVIATLLSSLSPQAQNTEGTEFWLTYGKNATANQPYDLQIRIVGGSQKTIGSIYFTYINTYVDFIIEPYEIFDHCLTNPQMAAVYNTMVGKTNFSIRINTSNPVNVYAFNYSPNITYDVTNVLPKEALGTEYYHISYTPFGWSWHDAYAVVATQNNTLLSLNGTPVETLNTGEVYYNTSGTDMTGYLITSNKPVAFFAVNQSAPIPFGDMTANSHLFQQLAPINTWDKTFFVPVSLLEKNIVRIVASKNNTSITQLEGGTIRYGVPGAQTNLTNLHAGEFVELDIHINDNGCYIRTDNPVGVCSYFTGTASSITGSNSAQCWIPGIGQKVTSVKLAPFIPKTYFLPQLHYALIYTSTDTKDNTQVYIGDIPSNLSGGTWKDNTIAGMSFYSMPLTNTTDPYFFTNTKGLIILGYGYRTTGQGTYYYLAGSAMRDLDAAFYANDIHFQDLKDNSMCEGDVHFRAEIEGLHQTAPERIKWFVNGAEEPGTLNQETWQKNFTAGNYDIRMWVRYENDDTISKTGTLIIKSCNQSAAFFANNVLHSELKDTTFCNKNVNFRAEIEGLHPTASDSIMWYIDNVFETSQATWNKTFENGTYEIKLVVHYDNDTYATLTGTLKVQALWIKIRNVRY